MTIIFCQCNNATKTKIILGKTYKTDCWDGSIINFLARLQTFCNRNADGGLSFRLYKQVVSVKSLNNFSNNKPHNPHGFKKEIKIKCDVLLGGGKKVPNRTRAMMELLKVEVPALDWAAYCAMPVTEQVVWKEKGDAFIKSILF